MTVYVDRNVFHIGVESYENDELHVNPLENFDCHLDKHDTTYFKNNENNQMNDNHLPEETDYVKELKDWFNGDSFQGDFLSGKRNAWGCYQWDSGDKYFGTFFNDKKHGYGYYLWPNGSTYLGTFYLDKRSGYGIMRYSDDSIYEGFFTDDYRYGPGILIENSIDSYKINIGYWKNDRLIRLKKSILHNNEFQFNKEFSQYNFYQLINLQLMFHNNQYQKSIKHDFIDFLNNQYQYNNEYLNELLLNNNSNNNNSTNYIMHILQIVIWNVNSPLFEKFIANYSFDCLLYCLPTIIEHLSIEQFNEFKQFSKILQSIQCIHNKHKNYTTNKQTLFDSRFQQNQTVNLVNMQMKITQISYLQEFLRNSCQLINWSNIFNLVTMQDFPIQHHHYHDHHHHHHHHHNQSNHNIDYCKTNQLLINDWIILWNKKIKNLFPLKKKFMKEKQLKFNNNHSNNQLSIIGKYELMSIQFIQYCFNGLYNEVKNLLQYKCNTINSNDIYIDPNVMDSHGQFGLLGAVLTWNMKLVNLLLDFGANINQLTDDGLTVFTICLLKYYELFKEIMMGKNNQIDQSDHLSQRDYDQQQQQQQEREQQRHNQPNHILSIITKTVQDNVNTTTSTVINDNVEFDEMKMTNMNNSLISFGRNYIYRVELPVLLSTTSSVSMVMLRRAARLSQIRRMHLNKIRAKTIHFILLINYRSSHQFKSRPKTISLDRRSKQLMIDNASKTAVINQPYTVTSSLLKEAAAYELSRNPYFLTSHSPNNSTKKQKQMMDIIDLLLKRGANPNTGIRPLPALFLAVQAGDPDMVRKLIQHGADANICLRVDNPSKSENRSSTGIYIDEDEAPLMPSLDGLTVLHYAVLVPDEMGVQLTEILLKDGQADPNKQATLDESFKLKTDNSKHTKISLSLCYQFKETISGKSTPEVKKMHEGRTPLHLVCSREYDLPNSAIIAECLLRHNANPNLLCNGHSALSVAIAVGNDPCINVLINHENTNINQPLENDLGSALCIACSSLFEFRRSIESRLELIKRLINKGGNVIDFTYMDYAKDTRIAKTPYHALNDIEKETYNGRMQILAYLAERLRNFAYTIEDTTDNEQITLDKIELHNKQMNQKTISSPIKTYSSKFSRQESPTYLKQNSCLPYSFCYECGRSAGVRLVLCSRCHRVYFCSKKNDQQLIKQKINQQLNVNLLHHLTCCSSSGELIGVVLHPSYRYQYLLHHYMKTDERGHIIIGTYDGDGNYSLG
ncbi:Ankyrin repeat and MYND domain-containing protein 1 [Schistosoma japonicum]|nr:Ankyrin repeat and MYND domain-containing protein 1 [Schistosoma japonicum]